MMKTLAVVFTSLLAASRVVNCMDYVFNFNDKASVDSWYEYSDVQRDGNGESKADFVLLESNSTRKAVFFGVANSLTHGNGAARVMSEGSWDWSQCNTILINLRGRSTGGRLFLVLNHKGINHGPLTTRYRLDFQIPLDSSTIILSLDLFKPPVTAGAEKLKTSSITSIGFEFDPTDEGQYYVAALEINWIAVA